MEDCEEYGRREGEGLSISWWYRNVFLFSAVGDVTRIVATVKRSTEREMRIEDGEIGTTAAKKMKTEIMK